MALVSAPALANMPALMAALGIGEDAGAGRLATLASALNLPETADETAILAAIGGMVPKAAHDATLAALTSTTEKLASLSATTRKVDVEATVDKALRELKIAPAQRDSYLAMCATEAGFETFRSLMAATMPMFRPSGLDGLAARAIDRPATAQEIIDQANAYRADKAKLGVTVSMSDAISIVGRQPAA